MRCSTCKELLIYTSGHRCPPCWDVRVDGTDDTVKVYASTEEDAAEKFTEDYDCYDLDVASQDVKLVVFVRSSLEPLTPEARYVVSGECVPQYHAVREEEPKKPAYHEGFTDGFLVGKKGVV